MEDKIEPKPGADRAPDFSVRELAEAISKIVAYADVLDEKRVRLLAEQPAQPDRGEGSFESDEVKSMAVDLANLLQAVEAIRDQFNAMDDKLDAMVQAIESIGRT